jgi:hypothetical protein
MWLKIFISVVTISLISVFLYNILKKDTKNSIPTHKNSIPTHKNPIPTHLLCKDLSLCTNWLLSTTSTNKNSKYTKIPVTLVVDPVNRHVKGLKIMEEQGAFIEQSTTDLEFGNPHFINKSKRYASSYKVKSTSADGVIVFVPYENKDTYEYMKIILEPNTYTVT